MDTEYNQDDTATEKIREQVGEAYEKAEQVVDDAYDKTSRKVSETYEKAKNYSNENPGKTIFIALGIGVGLGLLLGASSHHRSRTSRIAEPVVNALSDVALAFFR
jgi:ElaB/YqjD/DUF883 family membrane-anchored ribosome-binding protein